MAARTLKLTDTMTREIRPLTTVEPGHLRFYLCGPTVYSYCHIGNYRTMLVGDLIHRTALALGWRVSYVSNITDVGHLTADDVADAQGDDKMEKALKSKEGERFVNVWDLADHYATSFKDEWFSLNMLPPLVWPKATQHMREQIRAIEDLIASGHAYETPTGVYFNVGSFSDYGKLSGNRDQDNLMRAVREVVQDDNKRHPADFALWKKDDKHLMQWFSPWGWGFPGWHIECSVMSMAYLGETLDLHIGGEDLIFPHHECEIAQSEALTGKPFCNHWLHVRFLQVEGEKMSKSKGTMYTLKELTDKGVDPVAVRYTLISVPYGKGHNFTMQGLRDAQKNVERFGECRRLAWSALEKGNAGPDTVGAELNALYEEALDAMCEDLNTSVALAKALEGTRVVFRDQATLSKASAESALAFLQKVDDLLGIVPRADGSNGQASAIPGIDSALVESLIVQRAEAKAAKDFSRADQIRQQLDDLGVEVRDTPDGAIWKPKPASV